MAGRTWGRFAEGDSDSPLRVAKANRYYEGHLDHDHHMAIALAAIRETQRLDAELAENIEPIGDQADEAEYFLGAVGMGEVIAARLRAGRHYR